MEFNFNINNYFKDEITIVGSRLIPDGFTGDRREIQDCISRVSYVLTVLGENSAKAQGLQKVITSGEKLRNTDHIVYVLVDPKGGRWGTGSVLGMLKMGTKHLYVFDVSGNNHELSVRCVLDFYVHESKQRMGLGKKLFEYMLKEENIEPQHLAIDKPSPKFLSFLRKHYSLHSVIPQMNNFVVFDGFFTNRETGSGANDIKKSYAAGVSSSSARYQSGRVSNFSSILSPQAQQSTSEVHVNQTVHFGRPAPHRPVSTVGLILQHKAPTNTPQSFRPGSASEEEKSNGSPAEENGGDAEEEKENIEAAVEEPESPPEPEEAPEEKEEMVAKPPVAEPVTSPIEQKGNPPPMRCNAQANKTQHLDLKFYHSSLCSVSDSDIRLDISAGSDDFLD